MPAEVVPDQILYGVEQAAKILGISPRLLWLFVANGDLPVRKIATRTLIERKNLEKFATRDHARPTEAQE